MANEFEDQHEDHEGGPVKSFLEHLEDLRWMLIKSSAAFMVAFVICLLAGDKVVAIIKWPLSHAKVKYPAHTQVVSVLLGTNRVGTFQLREAEQKEFALGTNQFVPLQLQPAFIGTNQVLTWHISTNAGVVEASQKMQIDLINLSPAGGFIVAVQVALYGGMVLASPFILYFVATFIFPALKRNEKKYIYRGLGFAVGLFFVGVAFCYFVLMPVALSASQLYSQWLGFSAFQWKADEYISFVCKFLLGMGLGFEMPVVILVLVKIGVLRYRTLAKARPYMIVINFVLGAVLTTPEVFTQVLMAVPLQILYEISVWIAWYWERKDRKRQETEELPTD